LHDGNVLSEDHGLLISAQPIPLGSIVFLEESSTMSPILLQADAIQLLFLLVLLVLMILWRLPQPGSPVYVRRRRKPPEAPTSHPYRGRRKLNGSETK